MRIWSRSLRAKPVKSGKVDFACLQPGHYDAGMKGLVTVAETAGATGAAPKAGAAAGHKH